MSTAARDRGARPAGAPLGPGVKRVHMVGIGGAGMEALARLLIDLDYQVSGSDAAQGPAVTDLRRKGVPVFVGHEAAQVAGADLLVHSSAVGEDNCERRAAVRMGIEQWSRARALGAVSRTCDTVAVAGTHGKTTTASLIADAVRSAGQKPRVAIGGWMGGRPQPTARAGDLLVAEADEYRRAFHELEPWIAVITNIEMEHVDCYAGRDDLVEAFGTFVARRRPGGGVAVNGDDPLCLEAVARSAGDAPMTYGFGPACEVRAEGLASTGTGSAFAVHLDGERRPVDLGIPGRHNISNALAAIAATHLMGLAWEPVSLALSRFTGVDRRYQSKGDVAGVAIVDDYAHHPTEISAAVATALATGRRVSAVFQPHTYSRTRHFREAFAGSLLGAHRVCVTSVYAARESPDSGDEGDVIVEELRRRGHVRARFVAETDRALGRSLMECAAGDLLLVMGAGDIGDHLDALLQGAA